MLKNPEERLGLLVIVIWRYFGLEPDFHVGSETGHIDPTGAGQISSLTVDLNPPGIGEDPTLAPPGTR